MINAALSTSLSGMMAAGNRLDTSANNVANLSSTRSLVDGQSTGEAYQAQRVNQTSVAPAGVQSSTVPKDPATFGRFDPANSAADENGITQYPNVDLNEEVVEQQIATYDFKANLKALKTADEMMENLLDITA
tara:strand:- start:394 stop:792 length:399 start_codon:yes stop_codon:yes gene_type:complete